MREYVREDRKYLCTFKTTMRVSEELISEMGAERVIEMAQPRMTEDAVKQAQERYPGQTIQIVHRTPHIEEVMDNEAFIQGKQPEHYVIMRTFVYEGKIAQ